MIVGIKILKQPYFSHNIFHGSLLFFLLCRGNTWKQNFPKISLVLLRIWKTLFLILYQKQHSLTAASAQYRNLVWTYFGHPDSHTVPAVPLNLNHQNTNTTLQTHLSAGYFQSTFNFGPLECTIEEQTFSFDAKKKKKEAISAALKVHDAAWNYTKRLGPPGQNVRDYLGFSHQRVSCEVLSLHSFKSSN